MATDPTEDPKPRSRVAQFAVPIVAALVGVGGGVAGAMFLGGGSSSEEEAAEEGEPEAAGEGEAQATEGEGEGEGDAAKGEGADAASADGAQRAPGEAAITSLGSFTVNLRGSGGGRVLRVEVQLETSGANAGDVAGRTVQLRDSVITAISDYTWSELEGTDGKVRLRDELLQRVNGITAPAVVERLYFTQFVVQ